MKPQDAYALKTEDQLEGQMTIFDFLPAPKSSIIRSLPDDFMNPPEEAENG